MTDDDFRDRIHDLEHGINYWRALALSLAGALALLLVIGAVAGVSLFSQATAERDRAEAAMREAENNAQRAVQAMQEAEVQRQEAAKRFKKN